MILPTDGVADLQRFALGLEYDGTAFSGWQTQSHARNIQDVLNTAIAAVADEPVSTAAAGRTDAGVHAAGQVVHFETRARRAEHSWWLGINSHLPEDVVVTWVRPVPGHFHARHSAVARTYGYVILNRPVRPALERDRSWWVRLPLDTERMDEAARCLEGEHDFSAFRAAGCQAKSPVRRIDRLTVQRSGGYVLIQCRATGFLHHMVRNLAGSLVRVGCGEASAAWLAGVLTGRDRRKAAPTAPPQGLYLAQVHYPSDYALPCAPPLPLWRDH